MIENGADEQMFKQAILDRGRGLILDTVEEIQERQGSRVRAAVVRFTSIFLHEPSADAMRDDR